MAVAAVGSFSQIGCIQSNSETETFAWGTTCIGRCVGSELISGRSASTGCRAGTGSCTVKVEY